MTDTATARSPLTDAQRDAAIEHFAAKLRFETDSSDVAAALESGERLVLVDSRGHAAWHQGHAAPAIHMPTAEIAERAPREISLDTPVVVYCWSPGCNGSTKAALQFSRLGYEVRELLGGFEYWAREGYDVVDEGGPVARRLDELTAPLDGASCDC